MSVLPSHPRVSIVVASYNRAELLVQAVQSALVQGGADIEVVVSDDCSPDNSVDRLRALGDPRVRVHTQPKNVGFWLNWTAALDMARGDFVVFLGDDDWLTPDFVERHLEAFDRHPSASAVFSPLEDRPDDGSPSSYLPAPFPRDQKASGTDLVNLLLESKVFLGSAMFRRLITQQVWAGTEADGMVADWGLILGLATKTGVTFAACEGCLYVKRVHQNRLSSKMVEVTRLLASVCERVGRDCGDSEIRSLLMKRGTLERITLSRHFAAVGDLTACRAELRSCLGRPHAQSIVLSQILQSYLMPSRLIRTARQQRSIRV